jgi:hypothetical protein
MRGLPHAAENSKGPKAQYRLDRIPSRCFGLSRLTIFYPRLLSRYKWFRIIDKTLEVWTSERRSSNVQFNSSVYVPFFLLADVTCSVARQLLLKSTTLLIIHFRRFFVRRLNSLPKNRNHLLLRVWTSIDNCLIMSSIHDHIVFDVCMHNIQELSDEPSAG